MQKMWDLHFWCEIVAFGVPWGWCEISSMMWVTARARMFFWVRQPTWRCFGELYCDHLDNKNGNGVRTADSGCKGHSLATCFFRFSQDTCWWSLIHCPNICWHVYYRVLRPVTWRIKAKYTATLYFVLKLFNSSADAWSRMWKTAFNLKVCAFSLLKSQSTKRPGRSTRVEFLGSRHADQFPSFLQAEVTQERAERTKFLDFEVDFEHKSCTKLQTYQMMIIILVAHIKEEHGWRGPFTHAKSANSQPSFL